MSYPRGIDELTTKELEKEIERRENSIMAGLCSYCGRQKHTTPPCRFPERHSGKEV